MEQKLLLIYNPYAGKGNVKNHLSDIIDLFVKTGYSVTVYPTQGKRDAARKTQKCAHLYDCIVCCGGDGTLNEVVSGLVHATKHPCVGYIPAGTTNDFANTLHLSKNMKRAAQDITTGIPFACDTGRFEERAFIYVASFGIFTEAAYNTPQEYKNRFGPVAYFLEGIKELSAVQSYQVHIEHDSGVIDDEFIFGAVSNSTSVAGIQSYHPADVKLDDGLFEVLLVRKPQNLMELHTIVAALLWKGPLSDCMTTFHTSRLTVSCEQELTWTLDGEFGGALKTATITNERKSITFLLPNIKKRLPDS